MEGFLSPLTNTCYEIDELRMLLVVTFRRLKSRNLILEDEFTGYEIQPTFLVSPL